MGQKEHFQIIVESIASETAMDVRLVRVLRLMAKQDLQEATEIVRYLHSKSGPVLLASGLLHDVADYYKELLEECGARVSLRPTASADPMLLRPRLNRKIEWNLWRGPKTVV